MECFQWKFTIKGILLRIYILKMEFSQGVYTKKIKITLLLKNRQYLLYNELHDMYISTFIFKISFYHTHKVNFWTRPIRLYRSNEFYRFQPYCTRFCSSVRVSFRGAYLLKIEWKFHYKYRNLFLLYYIWENNLQLK